MPRLVWLLVAVVAGALGVGLVALRGDGSQLDQLEAHLEDACTEDGGTLTREEISLSPGPLRSIGREHGVPFKLLVAREKPTMTLLACEAGGFLVRHFRFGSGEAARRVVAAGKGHPVCLADAVVIDRPDVEFCDDVGGSVIDPSSDGAGSGP